MKEQHVQRCKYLGTGLEEGEREIKNKNRGDDCGDVQREAAFDRKKFQRFGQGQKWT